MAKGQEEEQPSTVGLDATQYEWETVHEEAPDQLVFEVPGDNYTGEYRGHEVINAPTNKDPDNWFIQLQWRDGDGLKVTNAGYELMTTYVDVTLSEDGKTVTASKDKIPPGTVTRTTLKKLVSIKNQESPMKSFQVETARANNQRG